MNRLILIGNGFDLAHGLKTSYNDFIIWYLKKHFGNTERQKPFEDKLIIVKRNNHDFPRGIKDVSDYIDHCYSKGLNLITADTIKIDGWQNNYPNPFEVEIKSHLFWVLLQKCSYTTWVEIENDFYELLKSILREQTNQREANLLNLNNSLTEIISNLNDYLLEIKPSHCHAGYSEIFDSLILKRDIVSGLDEDRAPEHTLVLNFNYTSTVEEYFKRSVYNLQPKQFKVNYIHGKLGNVKNPLIFGFGDELDSDYNLMELEKLKGFFKFIKSFWYFKTSNYHDLLRFIETNDYQIYILGHSCGLSDRTMLNMLFEHPNCKSIKIFFYDDGGGYNNYEDLTLEISRHFKDKLKMRRIIVSKNNSTAMPQVESPS